MRFRVVHPSFWDDKILGRLPDTARLVYIGLWMLSDDAGWSDWDPEQMALRLFPWVPVESRMKRFNMAASALISADRVRVHECGHAFVPKLAVYQRAGHPTYSVRDKHRSCRFASDKEGLEPIGSNGLEVIGTDSRKESRVGDSSSRVEDSNARSRAHEETGLKARLGDFSDIVKEQ